MIKAMEPTARKSFEIQRKDKKCYIPKRYIVTLLGFWGIFNVYTLRSNVSVALVAMVKIPPGASLNKSIYLAECEELVNTRNSSAEIKIFKGEQFDWDAQTQGYVMSSFFYCYFITVLTGGYLADRFGAKRVFGGAVFAIAILTLLTPVVVHWGVVPFLILRALEGISEGLTFPTISAMIGRWSPKLERSRMSTFIFLGTSLGTVFSFTVAGWLCSTDLLGGWPSAFYVFGVVTCIWFVFWTILIYDTPVQHPTISIEELSLYSDAENEMKTLKVRAVPWKKMATSVPVWALLSAQIGTCFGSIILFTEIPTYLSRILHFNIENSGAISGVPYISECIGGWTASIVADKLISSRKFSVTSVRKIFNSLAFYGTGLCLLGIVMSGCHPTQMIVIYSLGLWVRGFRFSGYNCTYVDMCPPVAGTLYGILNGIGYMVGLVGPMIVGVLTQNGDTRANWNNVFYITAAVYFVTGTLYAIFASAEPQNWLEDQPVNKCQTTKEMSEQNL